MFHARAAALRSLKGASGPCCSRHIIDAAAMPITNKDNHAHNQTARSMDRQREARPTTHRAAINAHQRAGGQKAIFGFSAFSPARIKWNVWPWKGAGQLLAQLLEHLSPQHPSSISTGGSTREFRLIERRRLKRYTPFEQVAAQRQKAD